MKIYTNTIDLANPSTKKFWVAPFSDFSIGVKFVVNNKPIDGDVILKTKDGVELTSNGKYGDGFTIFNMKSAEANETTEYIAIAPNGQENIIVQNVSDSTVYDVNANADKTESIDLATPFTIELGDTTDSAEISFSSEFEEFKATVEYRIDDDEWQIGNLGNLNITLEYGKRLQIRATDAGNETLRGLMFNATIPTNSLDGLILSGNIMTLLDKSGKLDTVPERCFENWLGEGMGSVIYDISKLLLPANTLGFACYAGMFYGCEKIKKLPELPATELAQQCYRAMFSNCYSLEYPMNELPATIAPNDCYFQMFRGCSSLKTIPDIKATDIFGGCFGMMFANCDSLKDLSNFKLRGAYNEDDESTNLKAYQGMFYQCGNLLKSPIILLRETIFDDDGFIKNGTIHLMFAQCTGLEEIYTPFLYVDTLNEADIIAGVDHEVIAHTIDGEQLISGD